MAMNRRCECPDDPEFAGYRPEYVEAYLINREDYLQSIEDWTDTEGLEWFATGEIYSAVALPIAITGSEANAFDVDMTRPEWRSHLDKAVKEAVVSAGLAKVSPLVFL